MYQVVTSGTRSATGSELVRIIAPVKCMDTVFELLLVDFGPTINLWTHVDK